MEDIELDLRRDVDNIAKIAIVPKILDVICKTTGMGFSAVARVTEDRWIACSVKDDIGFGLLPGGELEIQTTICNEIRANEKGVIIDNVSTDPHFRDHHTPKQYGFQSYISIPIILHDKSFFGTLCAIDPKPNVLNTDETIRMFELFAELIAFHLEALDQIDSGINKLQVQREFNDILERKINDRTLELKDQNLLLIKKNRELEEFNHISSHDLQEPLRKIQTFISMIEDYESDSISEKAKEYLSKIGKSTDRMRDLINDLLLYSEMGNENFSLENTNLELIVNDTIEDLNLLIKEKSAKIVLDKMCSAYTFGFQMKQLFCNLINNSLKYSSQERQPIIEINAELIQIENHEFLNDGEYCQITISDNGIGFEQKYSQQIFELFKRLHDDSDYSGTGIGLALVKKIVNNHQGQIEVQSEPEVGTEFKIIFPNIKS